MSKDRTPFIAVDADIDARLDRLAEKKGVGTMVRPIDVAEGPKPASRPQAQKPEPEIDPDTIPTPRTQMKHLNLEVPDYLWRELKVRAAHRGTTVRHVILTSLKTEGFEMRAADMSEDGRQSKVANER